MAWKRRKTRKKASRVKLPTAPTKTARKIRLPYPKDEKGNPLCRWCRTLVLAPRISWCSDACVEEYRRRYDNRYQRRLVLKRDKGICVTCRLDCVALARRVRLALKVSRAKAIAELVKAGLRASDLRVKRGRIRALWQADHIVPVVEGGAGCDIDGLRTLCSACHRKETAALMARRRAAANLA